MFKGVTFILCFLHAFLNIRDRAKHLKESFDALSEPVWEAYHASDPGSSRSESGGSGSGPRPMWRSRS